MPAQFQNFYESTLSAPISDTDLVIPINVPPSVTEGWLLIDYDIPSKREFVYFTSANATTVTVPMSGGRGQDGTTAIAHNQNAKVRMNVNAGILEGLQDGSALTDIGNANLSTVAGDIGGVWKNWTPTLGNLTGGTLTFAKYTQIGKTVHVRFRYALAGAGVTGAPTVSLPVTPNTDYGAANTITPSGNAMYMDANGPWCAGFVYFNSSTATITFAALNASATYATVTGLSSTIPFTWASGDAISFNLTYEAA